MLDPSQSTSFSPISCDAHECEYLPGSFCPTKDNNYNTYDNSCVFKFDYATEDYSAGEYVKDAITVTSPSGRTRISKINIGCAHRVVGSADAAKGFAGMNLGPNALISQLPFLKGKFSYCLNHYSKNAHSTLFLGETSASSTMSSQSIRILNNPNGFYLVHLQSITVGNTVISRCNASLDLNLERGTIFDSGNPFTVFTVSIFNAIKNAFVDALPGVRVIDSDDLYYDLNYDVCFDVSSVRNVKVPTMTFNFHGASWQPPQENYVRFEGSQMFLLILGLGDSGGVIGNIMQQNYLFTYDARCLLQG